MRYIILITICTFAFGFGFIKRQICDNKCSYEASNCNDSKYFNKCIDFCIYNQGATTPKEVEKQKRIDKEFKERNSK